MRIVWDEPKRLSNLKKHKLDFRALTEEWFDQAYAESANRGRLMAIGRLDDGTIAVICAEFGREAVSVISMRWAKRSERRKLLG